jgi:hypothetical protein
MKTVFKFLGLVVGAVIIGVALAFGVFFTAGCSKTEYHPSNTADEQGEPQPHCENAERLGETSCYNYSVVGHHREVNVFVYQDDEWVFVRHRVFEDQ